MKKKNDTEACREWFAKIQLSLFSHATHISLFISVDRIVQNGFPAFLLGPPPILPCHLLLVYFGITVLNN